MPTSAARGLGSETRCSTTHRRTTHIASGWMTQLLDVVFGELGISQYLESFLEQGFDTWETILDITESDLYVRRRLGGKERRRVMLTGRLWTAMRWG